MADLNLSFYSINDQCIDQSIEDSVINGVFIPKGYINATKMCKFNGKKFNDYSRLKKTQEYITGLSSAINIPINDLILTIKVGTPGNRGTWVHHTIALDLATWISVEFKLWAYKTIWHIITGNLNDLNKLRWMQSDGQRLLNDLTPKQTRRTLTDAIKDWYERNPGATSRPDHVMYAATTNAIYERLWGIDAIALESHLGCDRHKSRDYIDEQSLRLLERAESLVTEYIDDDNIKPVDAVPMANIRLKPMPTLKLS